MRPTKEFFKNIIFVVLSLSLIIFFSFKPWLLMYPEDALSYPLQFSSKAGDLHLIGKIRSDSCDKPDRTAVTLESVLKTNFGRFPFIIRITHADTVKVELDNIVTSVPVSKEDLKYFFEEVCILDIHKQRSLSKDEPKFTISEGRLTWLSEILEAVFPECKAPFAANDGWTCASRGEDNRNYITNLSRDLKFLQASMIQRASRQPYVLMRRLTLSIQLADALLQDRDKPQHLDKFCKLLDFSLPVEMPRIFVSRRWHDTVCSRQDIGFRTNIAAYGLEKARIEIDIMRRLLEETSLLGKIIVRIKGSELPGRYVLVSLKPKNDVSSQLIERAKEISLESQKHQKKLNGKISYRDTKSKGRDQFLDAKARFAASVNPIHDIGVARVCWHPFFSSSDELFTTARFLGIAGKSQTQVNCDSEGSSRRSNVSNINVGGPSPERFIADTITSETEFIISNGDSKTLRLPIGAYDYSVLGLASDPNLWDYSDPEKKAQGEIQWTSKRPSYVIQSL